MWEQLRGHVYSSWCDVTRGHLCVVEREYDMGEGWDEYYKWQNPIRRNVGVIQLRFLIGLLHLIGVWFGEDKKPMTMTAHAWKISIGLRLQVLATTPHSIVNTIGRPYVYNCGNWQMGISDYHAWIRGTPIF